MSVTKSLKEMTSLVDLITVCSGHSLVYITVYNNVVSLNCIVYTKYYMTVYIIVYTVLYRISFRFRRRHYKVMAREHLPSRIHAELRF